MITKNDILESGVFDFKVFPAFDDVSAQCSGKNQKGLLIVLMREPQPGLLAFLEKVLMAVQYDLEEDALTVFLTGDQRFSFSQLAKNNGIQKALFFGLPPVRAGLNLNPRLYSPLTLGNQMLLFSDELPAIEQDKNLKKQLWEALQLMFPPSA